MNCFATPPIGDLEVKRVSINNFDFALFKKTAITERAGIEFRFEFFNLVNHP